MKYKYVPIQGRESSYITKYPKGVFSLCWNLIKDEVLTEEEKNMFISIDNWFKEKLEPAIALLEKYKKPYDIVYTNFVGKIVYEDEWQVAVSVEDGEMSD